MVPLSLGTRRRDHDEVALVLVFADARQADRAELTLKEMDKYSEIELIKSREIQLQARSQYRFMQSNQDLVNHAFYFHQRT